MGAGFHVRPSEKLSREGKPLEPRAGPNPPVLHSSDLCVALAKKGHVEKKEGEEDPGWSKEPMSSWA